MATLPLVGSFVNAANVTFFDAAGTAPLDTWAAGFLGTTITSQLTWTQSSTLGFAYGDTSYFQTIYSSQISQGNVGIDNFLNAVNTNLTGSNMTISSERTAFEQQFAQLRAAGDSVSESFGVVAATLTTALISGYTAADFSLTGTDATTWNNQESTALNRTSVSNAYAAASGSTTPSGAFLVPTATTGEPWAASQLILTGVTADSGTVTNANAQISAALTAGNVTPIVGQSLPGQTYTLTTGQDTIPPAGTTPANNNTVNGIGGGPTGSAVGSTFTPNDSINFGTTTGNIFNLQGIGPAGTWDVTSVPGAKVSGIQTVNIASNTLFGALSSQAVTGDFTGTGPEGDWTGLTLLAVSSGSGILGGVDNLTVGPTTAVQVTDSLIGPTATPMTINGGSTVTISENNTLGFGNGGITVNGGTGTTSVSITQTEIPFSATDGVVLIQDAGFAAAAAGTIKTVILDGLDTFNTAGTFPVGPPDASWVYAATINDNALANLTINDVTAFSGTSVLITDNLATPTATTLNLSLNNDGNDPTFLTGAGVTLVDANNEISTLHLTLGNQASTLTFWDNGLTSVDIPTPATGSVGTGVLNATFNDNVANAVNFDFSNSNAVDTFIVNRGTAGNQNDVFSIGNGGTDLFTAGRFQSLTITNDTTANTDTINFGSGANFITDAPHDGITGISVHNYVNTVANGVNLNLTTINAVANYTAIANNAFVGGSDTLLFKGDPVSNIGPNFGAVASVQAGVLDALTTGAHTASTFNDGVNTYIFDHADTTLGITAHDSLVELVGTVTAAATAVNASHVITLLA